LISVVIVKHFIPDTESKKDDTNN